jgi:ParB/RepB/Spo0J family partition protein
MSTAKSEDTPLMKQYNTIKAKYPDAILLFRVGDFYETFGEDAVIASKVLGTTLTTRTEGMVKGVPLTGFPFSSMETYLPKLVKAGHRVAICDQLEDPKAVQKILNPVQSIQPPTTMQTQIIPIKNLIVRKEGTRTKQDEQYIRELADNITSVGLLQPITVVPNTKKKDTYHVLAGRQRLAAYKLLGRDGITCVVKDKLSADEQLDIEIAENLHRKDIGLLDEAAIVGNLLAIEGANVFSVSVRLNKPHTWVLTRKHIAALPESIRLAFAEGRMSRRSLLSVIGSSQENIDQLAKDIVGQTVRDFNVGTQLNQAPFDLEDVTLTAAGACIGCVFNSGSQELFDSPLALCTKRSCFDEKKMVHVDRIVTEVIDKGGVILTERYKMNTLDKKWDNHPNILAMGTASFIPLEHFEAEEGEEYIDCYSLEGNLIAKMVKGDFDAEKFDPPVASQETPSEVISDNPEVEAAKKKLRDDIAAINLKHESWLRKGSEREREFLIAEVKKHLLTIDFEKYAATLPDDQVSMLLKASLTSSIPASEKESQLASGIRSHLINNMSNIAWKSSALKQYAEKNFPRELKLFKTQEDMAKDKKVDRLVERTRLLQKELDNLG